MNVWCHAHACRGHDYVEIKVFYNSIIYDMITLAY
jgi:hypothetical protein